VADFVILASITKSRWFRGLTENATIAVY